MDLLLMQTKLTQFRVKSDCRSKGSPQVQIVQCEKGELDKSELSKQKSASEALIKVYSPKFTKNTKSEETVVFTSGLIYKYAKIKSQYSKETHQQSRNVPEDTQDNNILIAKENESNR